MMFTSVLVSRSLNKLSNVDGCHSQAVQKGGKSDTQRNTHINRSSSDKTCLALYLSVPAPCVSTCRSIYPSSRSQMKLFFQFVFCIWLMQKCFLHAAAVNRCKLEHNCDNWKAINKRHSPRIILFDGSHSIKCTNSSSLFLATKAQPSSTLEYRWAVSHSQNTLSVHFYVFVVFALAIDKWQGAIDKVLLNSPLFIFLRGHDSIRNCGRNHSAFSKFWLVHNVWPSNFASPLTAYLGCYRGCFWHSEAKARLNENRNYDCNWLYLLISDSKIIECLLGWRDRVICSPSFSFVSSQSPAMRVLRHFLTEWLQRIFKTIGSIDAFTQHDTSSRCVATHLDSIYQSWLCAKIENRAILELILCRPTTNCI